MKHFKMSEFERSNVAKQLKVDNSVPVAYQENVKKLVSEILDPVREHFTATCYITSGYRCPKVNKAVKGSVNSQHMYGEAADIMLFDIKPYEVFVWIYENCNFDQLILYPTFVHVSYTSKRDNRHEAMIKARRGLRSHAGNTL